MALEIKEDLLDIDDWAGEFVHVEVLVGWPRLIRAMEKRSHQVHIKTAI